MVNTSRYYVTNNYCSFFVIESLLIIPLVGCQITRKHNIGSYIKFVLWDDIQNIFINEVITEVI